jgi:hypothetical protein
MVIVAALAALVTSAAGAQGRIVATGMEYRTLSLDSGLGAKSVSELVVPIALLWPVSRRVTVDVGTRFASATREDESGASATLSGLTDLQARAVVQVVPDRVLFTLAANLPTGKAKLTGEELAVAGVIASDFLPFPVSSFGNGLNVTSGLALAVPIGGWAVGLAGSYRVSGEYTPLADTNLSYKAGGEMRLRIGLDRIVGQGRVSLGFTYSSFATDEFAGFEAFSPGNRYIGQASWSFPIGNVGVSLYAWDLYRNAGEIPANDTRTEKQNVLTLGGGFSFQLGRNQLRPTVEYRRHTLGVERLEGAGTLLSVGLRYHMGLGERWAVVPAFRFDTGNIANEGSDVGFTGFSGGLSLRANL